jgi:hypothetical protein
MSENTRETLRAQLPHVTEDELHKAYEGLQRYVRLAVEVFRAAAGHESAVLTPPEERGRVSAGKVDPGTFTNTR